ncbi:MAG: hypothetical protein QM754_21005 [Tepidisphaeraceae bacterium]
MPGDRVKLARRVLSLLATYDEIADLVSIGAFVAGQNAEQDLSVMARPRIVEFLKQEAALGFADAHRQLDQLCQWIDQAEKAIAAKAAAGTKPANRR